MGDETKPETETPATPPPVKGKKPRKVNIGLIDKADPDGGLSEPYRMMYDLLREHHPGLLELNFYLVWLYNVREDNDGRATTGKVTRLSTAIRIRTGDDLEFGINYDLWSHPHTTYSMKMACLDDLLMQVRVLEDDSGELIRDEKGRLCLGKREHDVNEFQEVVDRWGLYNRDLRSLAATLACKVREVPVPVARFSGTLKGEDEDGA